MTVPIGSIFQDSRIILNEGDFGNSFSGEELYAGPLYVWKTYTGSPINQDITQGTRVYDLTHGREIVDEGLTMILSRGSGHKVFVVYFPNDQQEVKYLD